MTLNFFNIHTQKKKTINTQKQTPHLFSLRQVHI